MKPTFHDILVLLSDLDHYVHCAKLDIEEDTDLQSFLITLKKAIDETFARVSKE